MTISDFKKWQVDKYHRNTQWFWLIIFLVNISIGFILSGSSGAVAGFLITLAFIFLYSALVGVHPEATDREN